jgi:DNA-binding response OmpR family regulator
VALERTRILIADDSLPIRELLAEYLATRGCEVVETADGREAIGLLQSSAFDAVITDLRVPGSDGTEILKSALALNPPVPCLIMTGFASVDSAVASFKAGAMDYIEKPFRLKQVWEAVQRAMEKARQIAEWEGSRNDLELYRECEAAVTGAELGRVLPKMASRIAGLVHADDVRIVLAGPGGAGNGWQMAGGPTEQESRAPNPFSLAQAALLLRRGRTAVLNAPAAEATGSRPRSERAFHLLVLPLKAPALTDATLPRAGCPGGIFAIRTMEKAGFSNDDLAALRHLVLLLTNTIAHVSPGDDSET